jgi:hypothetical protein
MAPEHGYLPITTAAYELTKKSGFYEKTPGPNIAVEQMIVKTTSNSRGVRLGNFVQVRTAIEEELENVWTGKKQPKEALDDAVKRGNDNPRAVREGQQGGNGRISRHARLCAPAFMRTAAGPAAVFASVSEV